MEQQQVEEVGVDIGLLSNGNGNEKQTKSHDDFIIMSVDDDDDDPPLIKEKRKSSASAKKPPKPPQRAFSLDAAEDQRLIQELWMIKRARIERMKTLIMHQKKKPSFSTTSSSSSAYYSASNLFAMIFTIAVLIILLFQGMSCQISCGTLDGETLTNDQDVAAAGGLIFIHEGLNPSAHDSV